ncbi:MAG: extracellular solute-binding protein [Burkholderiales bacterium]|nr:extracellular solute-binding protein [Burkholderiales bacterium]
MSSENGISRRETFALAMGGLFALTSSEASAQGQANLTFWTVRLNTPELSAALKSILADFEKENPGIKVKHEPVSGSLVYPKFLTAIRGQSMPDIAEAFSYHPLQFAAVDQMEPMDDIIALWKSNGILANIFSEFAYKKFSGKTTTGACRTTSTSGRSTTVRTSSRRRASSRPRIGRSFRPQR